MKKLFLLGMLTAGTVMLAEAQVNTPMQIGVTTYDLQSNGASGNRLVRNADGTLSAVWTENCSVSGGTWPTRGIGYNFYDGNNWVHGTDGTCDDPVDADFGISDIRVGWPEVVSFGQGAGSKEMVISHTPLRAVTRSPIGQGPWSLNTALPIVGQGAGGVGEGTTWPRVVADGDNVHMVAAGNAVLVNGVMSGIAYYRSTDRGATWNEVALPGMDGSSFNDIGGDNYALHANNGVVAITAGNFDSDWVAWKSTDSGLTWTKHIIRKFDPTQSVVSPAGDTVYQSNDSYHAVLVGHTGRVHAWAGAFQISIGPDATQPNGWTTAGIFPQSEGIFYWNDTFGQDGYVAIVEEIEDVYPTGSASDYIGNGTYLGGTSLINSYQGSYTSMSNAALAPNGDIYLVYSAAVEGTSNSGDSTGQSFRDLYVMKGMDDGFQWSDPVNLPLAIQGDRSDFEEDIFPSVGHIMGPDYVLHVLWQMDDEPGLNVRIDLDTETLNNIMYAGVNVGSLNFTNFTQVGMEEAVAYVNSIEAYPNPTNGVATIKVDLKQAANVQVRVTNLLGQEVATLSPGMLEAGARDLAVDLTAQPSGIYLYSIISDNFTVTKRLVKE